MLCFGVLWLLRHDRRSAILMLSAYIVAHGEACHKQVTTLLEQVSRVPVHMVYRKVHPYSVDVLHGYAYTLSPCLLHLQVVDQGGTPSPT